MTDDDERLAREREFHDQRFAEGEQARPADRFYRLDGRSAGFALGLIAQRPPGGLMLDYGCGEGAYAAIEGARRGQNVIAIDLSPVAIEQARRRAEEAGVADRIDFRVMNAEALDLPDDEFDFVAGLGVIHHLNIAPALAEIARVLKPDGDAMFSEPLGHNPAINLYRRRTPDQRTPDEHPLLNSDMPLFRAQFGNVQTTYFHLAALLAVPLMSTRWFDGALSALNQVDDVILKTGLRRWAWMVVLQLSQPRAVATASA